MQKNNIHKFILVEKKVEAKDITSLFFKPIGKEKFIFIPGQFVVIKPKISVTHGKSYTISSIPKDKVVCITVKKQGEISSAIINMKIGTKIDFQGPFGHFYPENSAKDIVMLAGGIGITPFLSIIKDNLKSNSKTKILLFYSNKTLEDIAFFDELNKMTENNSRFNVFYNLTQEDKKVSNIREYSRINNKILKKYLKTFSKKDYYLCGSIGFVRDMWKILRKNKVSESNIFTESFF